MAFDFVGESHLRWLQREVVVPERLVAVFVRVALLDFDPASLDHEVAFAELPVPLSCLASKVVDGLDFAMDHALAGIVDVPVDAL